MNKTKFIKADNVLDMEEYLDEYLNKGYEISKVQPHITNTTWNFYLLLVKYDQDKNQNKKEV